MARWLLLFCFFPTWAGAGYYVQVSTSATSSVVVGSQSQCYLTPTMAWASLLTGGNKVVSAVTDTTIMGTIGGYSISATYGECNATPLVTGLPTFLGTAADPAIQAGSIVSGGGSSGSCQSLVNPLAPEVAVQDSTQFFALAMGLLSLIWAGKTLYRIFSGDMYERG